MRLSAIVTCTQPWPEVRGCLELLLAQAGSGDIEIIVADGSDRGLDAEVAARVTWLRCPGRGPHELRWQGLTEARGDVVAITEDHCDVPPDWCLQMLCAHARHPDAAAIAGSVTNGATSRTVDRASFLLVHGSNVPGRARRSPDWFPPVGSNVSYKRERVLPLVREPGDLELVVTPQLWRQGALRLDESIVVAHSQSMSPAAHVANHFHAARSHAGLAARRGVPARRRALVRDAVGLPRNLLRPALGACREVPPYRSDVRRLVPAMTALAFAATAGYLAGVAGPGRSLRRLR
jgi:Glycosyl transferase family 2